MELHDFAERVLFSTSLEEKLAVPEYITDEHPGAALLTPDAPARPPELRFKSQTSGKADFPGLHHLEHDLERGRLLHFFANHELLATELMALVLLRFPEAPEAFRRGVCQTLKDEQLHTRLYLQRMADCGLHFGELPVSGYFWRTIAPMESPLDYVTGLCLTFEQANLDFCQSFARAFQRVGDSTTADLLARIYRDEIGHVAYGLKWFRRWKRPEESDWEAFCRQLKFPLSPQRAKGPTLNVQGRRAAGLDPAFIAELDVYSHSKGRTPNVFVFNPFAEAYIASGRNFTPVKHQARLAEDLGNLPQFLCRADDVVLVPKRPSVGFLSEIKRLGFSLPQFVELCEGRLESACELRQRKLGGFRPWAWGPDSLELLEPLFANAAGAESVPHHRYNQKIAQLYSKAWSADFLRAVLVRLSAAERGIQSNGSWICSEREVGVVVNSFVEALATITTLRRLGHSRLVAKEALGLAGHNAIRLWEPELLSSQRRWLERAFRGGGQLVIEPWLERVMDFSIQLEMSHRGLQLRGYTGLINDLRGQFLANWAEPASQCRLPGQVAKLLRGPPDILPRLHHFYRGIIEILETELRRADFIGPLGIDAFIYSAGQGQYRLKPLVELNPRYTMGRLTLELMRHTCPGTHGVFRLLTLPQIRRHGSFGFVDFARQLTERFPMELEGEPSPRMRAGAFCLNEPERARVCLATFQVGHTLTQALAGLAMNSP